ncbi:MAG TPA: SlyX family protein [Pirellulaceae bacterium]|jgi:uncharacterized coiled-coil protein SlyX|nr:SlyX family protein [Pirellulaceae bacterium]
MSDVDALLRRVVQLEELFSHHQHHVQQLNEVIVQLRGDLDALQIKYANQQSRLESLQERQAVAESEDLADQKPPHY